MRPETGPSRDPPGIPNHAKAKNVPEFRENFSTQDRRASAPRTGDEGLPEWARGHRLAVAVARTATADARAVEGEIARWLASHLPAAPLP